MPTIIGVKFRNSDKIYYFGPKNIEFHLGDNVIVETVRGQEYATVGQKNTEIPDSEVTIPIKDVIRKATEKDTKQYEENCKREANALKVCAEKAEKHGLKMKLINAEYTFDRSKIVFNYTADGRVDFRELVKDLAQELRTRIELHQVYERDDIRLRGAMGICGRPCCCIDCQKVCTKSTVKMAKNQNLSLNPTKVSGICGKLMCCLRFENDYYVEAAKNMPKVNAIVSTEDGNAKVIEVDYLRERIKCILEKKEGIEQKYYANGEYTILTKPQQEENLSIEEEQALEELNKMEANND